jgi:hypothetical protein
MELQKMHNRMLRHRLEQKEIDFREDIHKAQEIELAVIKEVETKNY